MIDLPELLSLGRSSSLQIGVGSAKTVRGDMQEALASSAPDLRLEIFSDAESLVSALADGSIDAAVRGDLSSREVLPKLRDAFGMEETVRAAILSDWQGRHFLLSPVGIDEGLDEGSRLRSARATISYFASVGWKLKVGVLSRGRAEDVVRGPHIGASIAEGERIARSLRSEGVDARHFEILLEEATREADLVLAPDGVTGNLIFRSLSLVGGRPAFGAPVVNVPRVFVDTSRARTDIADAVLLAAGLAQRFRRA